MRSPFVFLGSIVTFFAMNAAKPSPTFNSSNHQSPPTGSCNKPPVNSCHCQYSVNCQSSQVTDAIKTLEKALEGKLEHLIALVNETFAPVKILEKKLENLIAMVNKTSTPTLPPVQPPGALVSSCKEQYEKVVTSKSEVYTLLFGSQRIPVYCHMGNFGCGDGGWTLAMKTDGTKRTFHYNSYLWSSRVAYNLAGGKTGFDNIETKLPTYWNTPFSKICLGMKIGRQIKFHVINMTANSLFSLIADGYYRPTTLGRNTWKNLIGLQASLQMNCNKEGFNAVCSHRSYGEARIGFLANNEKDCFTCDSRIGFGTGGRPDDSNTCGNEATPSGDNGEKRIKAIGYVLVQ